jgi:hypothetical protein
LKMYQKELFLIHWIAYRMKVPPLILMVTFTRTKQIVQLPKTNILNEYGKGLS